MESPIFVNNTCEVDKIYRFKASSMQYITGPHFFGCRSIFYGNPVIHGTFTGRDAGNYFNPFHAISAPCRSHLKCITRRQMHICDIHYKINT
jgi:hypothetical protein